MAKNKTVAAADVDQSSAPQGVEAVSLVAIEPLRLDGVDVAPGKTFSAFAGDAQGLLATGAARLVEAE